MQLTALALIYGESSGHLEDLFDENDLKPETKADLNRRLKKAERARKTKQGLKRFKYGETQIWARNQENADRKAKNKGLI